jgi:PII-like signaling protein
MAQERGQEGAAVDGWTVLELYTSERVHRHGASLADAVARAVHDADVGARCLVFKAIGGTLADGSMVSHHVLDLATDLPLKVEILVPTSQADGLVARLRPLTAGEVLVRTSREPA